MCPSIYLFIPVTLNQRKVRISNYSVMSVRPLIISIGLKSTSQSSEHLSVRVSFLQYVHSCNLYSKRRSNLNLLSCPSCILQSKISTDLNLFSNVRPSALLSVLRLYQSMHNHPLNQTI